MNKSEHSVSIISSSREKLDAAVANVRATLERFESRVFSIPRYYDMLGLGKIHSELESFKKNNNVSNSH